MTEHEFVPHYDVRGVRKQPSRGPSRLVPPPPPGWPSWEDVMTHALAEAQAALAHNDVPVGAVVLNGHGAIIGRGHNRSVVDNDPSAHAEIVALRAAAAASGNYRLEGCCMVVTLEPCLMCAGALAHARLAGLVYGGYDLRAGAVLSCYDALDQPYLQHRVWHMGGILEEQCVGTLQRFFAERRE